MQPIAEQRHAPALRILLQKIRRALGWEPKHQFDKAIRATIQWYRDNEPWWRGVKSGEYLKYYQRQYGGR